jgi:hypothetical protein
MLQCLVMHSPTFWSPTSLVSISSPICDLMWKGQTFKNSRKIMNGGNWPPFSIDYLITNRNLCKAKISNHQHLKLTSGIQCYNITMHPKSTRKLSWNEKKSEFESINKLSTFFNQLPYWVYGTSFHSKPFKSPCIQRKLYVQYIVLMFIWKY